MVNFEVELQLPTETCMQLDTTVSCSLFHSSHYQSKRYNTRKSLQCIHLRRTECYIIMIVRIISVEAPICSIKETFEYDGKIFPLLPHQNRTLKVMVNFEVELQLSNETCVCK